MNIPRKAALMLVCAVFLCAAAHSAQAACNAAWSKDEARDFLVRAKALPEGYELAATWLQATGKRNGYAQAMAIAPAGNGAVTVRYVIDGRLLDDAEAKRLGLSAPSKISPKMQQAPMKPGGEARFTQKRPVPRLTPDEMKQVPRTVLSSPDMKRVAEEDAEAATAEKAMRIGVFQDLPQPLEAVAGAKSALAGGTVWATAITSPGALGQRIAFDQLTLPAGAEIILYDAANPADAFGPLDTANISEWPYWAPACPGETVMVECRFPNAESVSALSLRITRVAHIYLDPLKGTLEKGIAGTCNKDVTCRPEWADLALAVGGLGVIGSSGVLFCTCTLLADANPCLNPPLVLTANHCVGGQTGYNGAGTLDFYWRYQTSVCDGTAPSLLSVPRTVGGADFLAGANYTSGSDFTLLRMHNEPPTDLPRMGWSATAPPVGTAVVCVHHPQGDFKRISDGTLTSVTIPHLATMDPLRFHQVTWDIGTTESGSSGSPLVIAATGQIIGQLWGGYANCTAPPTYPDYYGRFDKTWIAIRTLLEPPGVFMDQPAVSVDEDAGAVIVTLSLSQPAEGPIDVLVTPEAGTALPGRDYTDTPQAVRFEKGQSAQSCVFPILPNERHDDANLVFTLRLSCPAGCAVPVAGQSTTEITLLDNDPPPPPAIPSLTIPWYTTP